MTVLRIRYTREKTWKNIILYKRIFFSKTHLGSNIKMGWGRELGGGGEGIYVSGYRKYGKRETQRKLWVWRGGDPPPSQVSGLLRPTRES